MYLANPHGLRWPTEIFLLREKRISVTRFVPLPLSLSWCGKTNPAERTFLPVRPAHGKWHTGLLYAVRPSFGPSKNAGLLAAGDTRKPAVCPCRNVCRPYFSNRLRRPPPLSPCTASPHTFSGASQGLSARDIHSPYGSGAAMRRLSDSLCGGPNM